MKRNRCFLLLILFLITLLAGCSSGQNSYELTEVHMRNYSLNDFGTIIIGESTYEDVYRIAPTESLVVTSYGGFCDFQTEIGGSIHIRFNGPNLVVGAIEEIIPRAETEVNTP